MGLCFFPYPANVSLSTCRIILSILSLGACCFISGIIINVVVCSNMSNVSAIMCLDRLPESSGTHSPTALKNIENHS